MSWIRVNRSRPTKQNIPVQPIDQINPVIPAQSIQSMQSMPTSSIQNSIWGPALWIILHSACERIDLYPTKLPHEESRIWIGLLQSLRFTLPCPQCKKHYSAYYGSAPVVRTTKEFIRNWLYTLHEQVNHRLMKPSYPIAELARYEAPFNFVEQYAIVHKHIVASVQKGLSIPSDALRTFRFLEELKCFYNL